MCAVQRRTERNKIDSSYGAHILTDENDQPMCIYTHLQTTQHNTSLSKYARIVKQAQIHKQHTKLYENINCYTSIRLYENQNIQFQHSKRNKIKRRRHAVLYTTNIYLHYTNVYYMNELIPRCQFIYDRQR